LISTTRFNGSASPCPSLEAHQIAAGAPQHLALGFAGIGTAALAQGAIDLRGIVALAPAEGVVVGDDDLRPLEVAEHVVRHQFPLAVIAVRVVRQQHAQPILDRDAGVTTRKARENL
jgi:hypothetical protein